MSGVPEERKLGAAPQNLNTIYEEFDLGDRIKALKGKHIKIKKLVKKDDGNYSIRESSLYADKSVDVSGISPGPLGNFESLTSGGFQGSPSDNILGNWSTQLAGYSSPIGYSQHTPGLLSSQEPGSAAVFTKKNYDSKYFGSNGLSSESSSHINTTKKEPVMASSGMFSFPSQSQASKVEPFV